MKARTAIVLLSLAILTVPALPPFAQSLYLGPRVKIDIGDTTLNEKAATVVYVTVYNETGVKVVGATVNIVAELGTFNHGSATTDAVGKAEFIYTAPSIVLEQRSANITATAVYDLPPYTEGKATIWLLTLPKVFIDGPDQVVKGGEVVRYAVRAVTGSEPLSGAVLNVTPPSLGTIAQNQQATDETGRAWFDYRPPAAQTGEVVLTATVTPPGAESVSGSKTIQIVAEILTMTVSIAIDTDPVPCWGSSNLTATVRKGNQTVAGATVEWTVTRGWKSASSTVTDANGRSRIQYTATNASGQLWAGTVTIIARATSGADRADTNMTFDVSPLAVAWTAELGYTSSGGQLFAGEKLTVNLSLRLQLWHPFQFITPVAVDLKLWSGSGTVVYNRTVAHGLSIEPGLDWSSGPLDIFTVPAVPGSFQYFWQARVTSNDSVYTYYEFDEPVKVTLLSQDLPEWTFLMYMCDINNLMLYTDSYLDGLEHGAPEDEFRYLVQRRGPNGVVQRWELRRDPIPDTLELEFLGNATGGYNMATPENLTKFLAWGAEYAPAKHYLVVIYDHGGGWEGACWNGLNPPDHIGLASLDNALLEFCNQRRKPDILFFEACLMSSAEVIYALRDRANYIFASEAVIWGDSLLQNYQGLRNVVASFGQGTPAATGLLDDLLDGYIQVHSREYPVAIFNLSSVGQFYASLGRLVTELLAKWNVMRPATREAASDAYLFHGNRDSGLRTLIDFQDFLVHLKQTVEELPLSYRYVDVLAAIDDTFSQFGNIFYRRYFDDRYVLENIGAMNIFFPNHNYYQQRRSEYRNNLSADFPWVRLLDAVFYDGQGTGPFQVWPPVSGITNYPLPEPTVNAQDPDGDGLIENISVGVLIDQISNGLDVNVILDSYASSGAYPGGIGGSGNMNGRTVIPGPAGQQTSQTSEIKSNTTDEVNVVATVVTPDGTILQQYNLGVFWMDGTPRTGSPPSLEVVASGTNVTEGSPVNFNATATDPDGDHVTIWWDLDERDGMGLDATGPSASRSYRGTGIRTMTCMASDGKNTAARQLEINVTANPDNRKPAANLTFSFTGANSVVLNASASTDPDGDALEYLFVFDDGNSTGWSNRSTAAHVFANGTYSTFVMVRDGCRYNGSSALVTFNVTGQAPPPPPPANRVPSARFVVISNLMGAKKPINFDASISSDPDNDTMQYRFDWGDGNATDWSGSKTASHTYAMPGNYNVTLSVRDAGNLTSSNTTTIVVKSAPKTIAPPKGFIPGYGAAAAVIAVALAFLSRKKRKK